MLKDFATLFALPTVHRVTTADGPVLTQTDLYLPKPKIELHPILTQNLKFPHLMFGLADDIPSSPTHQYRPTHP